jgi:hypothetical protein
MLAATLERGMAHDVAALLNRIARDAAAHVASGQGAIAAGVVDHYHAALLRIYHARLEVAALESAKLVIEELTGGKKFLDLIDLARSSIMDWLTNYAAEKVVGVQKTTKKIIRKALSEGQQEAESLKDIAKRVRAETGGEIGKARAITIARTEVGAATAVGADAAADASGLTIDKEWCATEDARTRPPHAAADGQTVAMDEDFTVGGEALKYPKDPNGSAALTINCRCVCLYNPRIPGASEPKPKPAAVAEPVSSQPNPDDIGIPKPKPITKKPKPRVKPAPKPASPESPTLAERESALSGWMGANVDWLERSVKEAWRAHGYDKVMSLREAAAVKHYTGSGYAEINAALRTDAAPTGGSASLSVYKKAARALNDVLIRLGKPHEGYVYRGVDPEKVGAKTEDVIKDYVVGKTVEWSPFTSASTRKATADAFGGRIYFIIEAKTPRSLKNLSAYPGENEVLFRAGTKFEVLDVAKRPDGRYRVVLAESPASPKVKARTMLTPAQQLAVDEFDKGIDENRPPDEDAIHFLDKSSTSF